MSRKWYYEVTANSVTLWHVPTRKHPGTIIRERRAAKHWSQMDLARRLGLKNRESISRWETGEVKPDEANARKLADKLGGKPGDYFTPPTAPPPAIERRFRKVEERLAALDLRQDRQEQHLRRLVKRLGVPDELLGP